MYISYQEDYGNKWTLGALLRYLREEGHDTKTLMSKIEAVIVKSIIAVEAPIVRGHLFPLFFW